MAIDPNYYNSSLLLNCEGANGSTTFTDISASPKTPTVNGDTKISTAQFKSGSAAMLFDGTGDWLEYASDPGFDFGTGDFGIELWWRPTGAATDYALVTHAKNTVSTQADVSFGVYHLGSSLSGKIQAYVTSGTTDYIINGLSALSANTWHHIWFGRISGTLYLYVNGVQQGFTACAASINTASGRTLKLGYWRVGSTLSANGYMDGIRIDKGVGRYTAPFTPSSALFEVTPPGTGDGAVTFPPVGLNAYGGANSALTLPGMSLAGYAGGGLGLALPMVRLYAVGHDATGENALDLALPALVLSGFGGATARMTLPAISLSADGVGTGIGRAEITLPALRLSSSGTGGAAGNAALQLPRLVMVAGYGGANASMRMPAILSSGQGQSGAVGSASISLPVLQLLASGTAQNHGSADLTLPPLIAGPSGYATVILPVLRLSASGSQVVAVTYEAYAMNLKPTNKARVHEVTRYTGMPFSGMVRWQGNWYGWGPSGMYLIGGDTDAGEPISWAWKTAVTNFGNRQMKVVRETFLHGRLGPTATASVSVGEDADVTYAAVIERGRNAQAHRIKYGKGLKAEYWSFGLADVTGSAMEVDSMQHEPKPLSRKI